MVVLLQVLAVLAVVFGVAIVLTGRAEGMSEEGQDLADTGIPRDRAMTPQDVIGLRFALAFRGYRMSEVDDALDRLAAEIAARDEAIERLRATPAPPLPVPEPQEWSAPEPREMPSQAAEPEPVAEVPPVAEMEPPAPPMEPPAPPPFPEPPVAEPATAPILAEEPPEPAAEATIFGSMPSPFRPEVPDIPTYDPWAVTPRSRYTDGPEYVEVDEHPEDDVEAITEHHTGYAPPPEPADETGTATDTATDTASDTED